MAVHFQSLRSRLLVPLVAAASLAAVGVAVASYRLGDQAVQQQVAQRFTAISETLSGAPFPFTPPVLRTLSQLTGADLVTYGADGTLLHSTIRYQQVADPDAIRARLRTGAASAGSGRVPGFLTRSFMRETARGADDGVHRVLVLFDEAALRRARLQAASLPLLTGISTVLLLSLTSWLLTRPLVRRITALQLRVERIAAGDFGAVSPVAGSSVRGGETERDELGRLGQAVQKMGAELASFWKTVHQQERQKLIHQLAAGLAHQLRNNLTGARMAVELHARKCAMAEGGGLDVAIGELQRMEDYVQRILMIASTRPAGGETAGTVGDAIREVESSLTTIANHQRIELRWNISPQVLPRRVADVLSLTAAVQNLVINALQAGGNRVQVDVDCTEQRLRIIVKDNGPGPMAGDDVDFFEPFVTTRPEGLGLGLTLVRRAADQLRGEVRWSRDEDQTAFHFTALLSD